MGLDRCRKAAALPESGRAVGASGFLAPAGSADRVVKSMKICALLAVLCSVAVMYFVGSAVASARASTPSSSAPLTLITEPNMAAPDDLYEQLIAMHRDLDEDASALCNAKLILLPRLRLQLSQVVIRDVDESQIFFTADRMELVLRAVPLLKQQVLELFRLFDQLRDGVVELIEVKDGLPFRVRVAEPLG